MLTVKVTVFCNVTPVCYDRYVRVSDELASSIFVQIVVIPSKTARCYEGLCLHGKTVHYIVSFINNF